MTLRDKFLPYVDCIYPIDGFENKEWGIRNAKECEQIADDYAIEFAKWVGINYFYNTWKESKSTKELLEIFKKEIK